MNVSDDGIPVDDLVVAVKNAIKLANISSTNSDRDLRVASAQLTLHAVATATGGGGIDFRIPFLGMKLKIGGSVTRSDTHIIDITLIPADIGETYEIRDLEIETIVVDAVETIRTVMARAAGGDDPFFLKIGTVDLSFAIKKDGEITFGFNGELKNELTHTLRISLGRPT